MLVLTDAEVYVCLVYFFVCVCVFSENSLVKSANLFVRLQLKNIQNQEICISRYIASIELRINE